MGTQEVHGRAPGEGRVVLPQGLHGLPEAEGVLAQQEGEQGVSEGVVHQPVAVSPQDVPAAHAVGDLVGAVLPHLADDYRLRLGLPGGGVDAVDKVVGQLVGHVQPPAVRPGGQPAADDAVRAAEDIPAVGGIGLIDGGEGVDAPPGVVFVRPV